MLVIGTSHGLILGFDSSQTLRWCDQEARHQGAVSALCFNHDGTRLLAGFARGHIIMLESSSGKVLRTLTDVHPPGTAVLHVKVVQYHYQLSIVSHKYSISARFYASLQTHRNWRFAATAVAQFSN